MYYIVHQEDQKFIESKEKEMERQKKEMDTQLYRKSDKEHFCKKNINTNILKGL